MDPTPMVEDVTQILRDAYDRRASERDVRSAPAWETEQRDAFMALLRQEHSHSLLELGAATGSDAAHFKESGFDVVCIDLSPEMVRRCEAKGLVAHVMDVTDLRFPPDSFDAVYAMNCLVHVPAIHLPKVLDGIRWVLKSHGLFYLGVYGGREFEGIWEGDWYQPKRFFSHRTDDALRRIVARVFDVQSFEQLPHGWDGLHFQSFVLRKGPTSDRQSRT